VSQLDSGATRILLSINPGKSADRIELFARTLSAADAGRAWFDALAGASVTHLLREVTDPRTDAGTADASGPAMPDLSPEETTAMFQQVMLQHYANWADEPVPMLGDLTPREAMKTPAGLERVKGLLRYYEDSEASMAQADGRGEASYQFLWDELGIER